MWVTDEEEEEEEGGEGGRPVGSGPPPGGGGGAKKTMKVTKNRPTNLGEGASPSTARPVGSGPPPGGGGGGQTGIKMTKKRAGRNRTPPPPPPPPLSSFAIRIAQAIRDSKFGEEWDSTPCTYMKQTYVENDFDISE